MALRRENIQVDSFILMEVERETGKLRVTVILTLRGLVQMTETELFKLPGIGKKSVEEIRLLLAEGGNRLKEEQQ